MKSTFLLQIFAFCLAASVASAQKITGSIHEPNGQPAGYATVTLYQSADSTLVKGAITGDDGAFEIVGATAGKYFLKANLIGTGETSGEIFDYKGGDHTLEVLTLKAAENKLAEVSIVARRPPVEVKADKTVLNVEGTVNSTGLNALELLRKAPGVTVDNNENINVRGKNAVKIMIDGRDVPIDGKDLAALLKGTQASDIATIEIISNPSARYDASGNAGIINIRLKKNKALGTNGNFGLEEFMAKRSKVVPTSDSTTVGKNSTLLATSTATTVIGIIIKIFAANSYKTTNAPMVCQGRIGALLTRKTQKSGKADTLGTAQEWIFS
ncbi:MAG: TonB-dependent receptor [Lewinellaceae bacterium]|nr:TonB-dependent receptor [Lewinellaceae bacterium]